MVQSRKYEKAFKDKKLSLSLSLCMYQQTQEMKRKDITHIPNGLAAQYKTSFRLIEKIFSPLPI